MLRQQYFSIALLCTLPAWWFGRDGGDTDIYKAKAPVKVYDSKYIIDDLTGDWHVRVPKQLLRKKEVIGAGIAGTDPDSLTPPVSDMERDWYDRASDRDAPYLEWYRCATTCR
ncbi:MAG: hypothetical protein GWP91_21160, partial [Rhodobacterales bacterium]|nr:hypothetical protein [Rhodobacterales bacterium]